LQDFFDNFGVAPDSPPPPLIPQRWRIPVFTGMVVIGAILLALLLWLVVLPAIHAQGATAGSHGTAQHAAPAPKAAQ
jgi:hypothetical protein